MQIHQLKANNKLFRKRRVGRGGKRGTYSGRGIKGQKSRAGAKIRPQIRETVLKFPKKRGGYFRTVKKEPLAIRLKDVIKTFPEGGVISPKKLRRANLVKGPKGKTQSIKILGAQSLSQSYIIKNCLISQKAREAVEKAGGKIESKNI